MTSPRIEALADDAWLIDLGNVDAPAPDVLTNAAAHALAARIRTAAPAWLRDLVPAYASLAVFFDPGAIDADTVRAWLHSHCVDTTTTSAGRSSTLVEIPVCYGDVYGEDLDTAAAELGMAARELIARHTAATYTVAMIGFAPGFPYLLGLDPALALPRLATPRTRVPAGSVAIGGAQTGIYPRESPGGWRLIGRTPLRLFDPCLPDLDGASPSLLVPGDRVRFTAVDADTFAQLACAP